MARTVFAMITLLEDGSIDPGFGNRPGQGGRPDQGPSQPIYHPGHPDHGNPVDPGFGQGGGQRPGQLPIFHPGHPDHGLPSQPGGGHPDQGLPWSPGSPDQGLPVPPGVTPPPTLPPQLQNKVVVLWHVPGETKWHGKAIEPGQGNHPDQGPIPPEGSEAQPKG